MLGEDASQAVSPGENVDAVVAAVALFSLVVRLALPDLLGSYALEQPPRAVDPQDAVAPARDEQGLLRRRRGPAPSRLQLEALGELEALRRARDGKVRARERQWQRRPAAGREREREVFPFAAAAKHDRDEERVVSAVVHGPGGRAHVPQERVGERESAL